MNNQKFPSEEQGAFDPVPTHPEPNSPAHTTRHPEEDPGIEAVPDDESPEESDMPVD